MFAFLDSGPPQLVSAAVMPECMAGDPAASYTFTTRTEISEDHIVERQPFAQAVSIDFVAEEVVDPDVPVQVEVFGLRQGQPVSHWLVPAPQPGQAGVVSQPVPTSNIPIAGSVDAFRLQITGLPIAPDVPVPDRPVGALRAAANLIQRIRV